MNRLLECRVRGKLGDRKTGDDELTELAVDHAQFGLCCDDAFRSLVDHDVDNLGWVYAYVNIDRSINMTSDQASSCKRPRRAIVSSTEPNMRHTATRSSGR